MAASSVKDLKQKILKAVSEPSQLNNVQRRALHARVELLRLDIEEELLQTTASLEKRTEKTPVKVVETLQGGKRRDMVGASLVRTIEASSQSEFPEDLEKELNGLVALLSLVPIKRPAAWWYWIDIVFRFVGVSMGFLTVGVLFSLPVIFLRGIDALLQLGPFDSISEWLKRSICKFFLILSGVEVDIDGVNRESFEQPCSLLTFSHASNLDGFLVSLTCPIRHYALAKKELFYVPFFSWISIAIGGVPVDRENRDRAVGALKRAADAAKKSRMCLVIAPEGTRSLTGQLLPFKKGVAHMWEELKAPIVPVVLFGGWDLYPVGSWVNQCGYVAVRYLKPIQPSEVFSRDHLIRLLRRRMLTALLDCPKIIGKSLSWPQRLRSIAVTLLNIAFDLGCIKLFNLIAFEHLGLSIKQAAFYTVVTIFAITIALYVYTVYVVDLVDRRSSKKSI